MKTRKSEEVAEKKLEEAYHRGHLAYFSGYALKWNPYERQSDEWEQWRLGWYAEKADDPYWEIRTRQTPHRPEAGNK